MPSLRLLLFDDLAARLVGGFDRDRASANKVVMQI